MCQENVWWLWKASGGGMSRRHNKVRLVLIQICSESIAIGRHLVRAVRQVRWFWWLQPNTDAWGSEDASRSSMRTLEIMLKLDVLKIYWSKASLFRFYERVLQLGDLQCTVQTRWGGYGDQGGIRKDEVWPMHQENLRWNLNSDWHRLLGEYYTVSLFLHRFCQRILQLGDFQRTMQTRSDYSDDQRKVWKNEVRKMHQEDHGRRYQGIARCWLLRRYH